MISESNAKAVSIGLLSLGHGAIWPIDHYASNLFLGVPGGKRMETLISMKIMGRDTYLLLLFSQ